MGNTAMALFGQIPWIGGQEYDKCNDISGVDNDSDGSNLDKKKAGDCDSFDDKSNTKGGNDGDNDGQRQW